MINIEILQETHKLCSLYEKQWKKEVDYIGVPLYCSQEALLQSLRIIVNTGDSVLCGLKKVKSLNSSYNNYLMDYHSKHFLINGFSFEKACPFCGNSVVYYEDGASYEYRCKTKNCFKSVFRGL